MYSYPTLQNNDSHSPVGYTDLFALYRPKIVISNGLPVVSWGTVEKPSQAASGLHRKGCSDAPVTKMCPANRVATPVTLWTSDLLPTASSSQGRKWQPIPVFLPGKIQWTEEPGGLQSMGLHRVGHDQVTENTHTHTHTHAHTSSSSCASQYLDSLSSHNVIIVDFSVELLT